MFGFKICVSDMFNIKRHYVRGIAPVVITAKWNV